MVGNKKTDPFYDKISDSGLESDKNISTLDIRRIIASTDCIEYYKEFTLFVQKYQDAIFKDQDAILTVVRTLLAIGDIVEVDIDDLVDQFLYKYEDLIINRPVHELDVDLSLNFMKLFLEHNRSIFLCISMLSAKLLSIDNDEELRETYNIIVNNNDIVNTIYDNESIIELRAFFGVVISDTFGSFSEE